MNKKLFRIYIFVAIIIFIMFISMFLLYYSYMQSKDKKEIYNNNVLLTYNNDEYINIEKLINNEYDYYFTIVNNGEKNSEFDIIFDIQTPFSKVIDKNLVYSLSGESTDKNGTIVNKSETPVPISSKVIGKGNLNSKEKQDYILNIKYNGKENITDKSFLASIKIVAR